MILVSGVFVLDPRGRDEAVAAAQQMAQATREEDGCISYAFYVDLEDSARVRVFEEWESEEALERHFQMPHMAAFREALGAAEILSRSVKVYSVSGARDL